MKFSFLLSYLCPASLDLSSSCPFLSEGTQVGVASSDGGKAETPERKGFVNEPLQRQDENRGLNPPVPFLLSLRQDPTRTTLEEPTA